MKWGVKQKIIAGTAFMTLLVIVAAAVGIYFTVSLKKEAELASSNNYKSLDYCQQMLRVLDKKPLQVSQFAQLLQRQKANITEPGEAGLTQQLSNSFLQLQVHPEKEIWYDKATNIIQELQELNIKALEHNSELAKKTADKALSWIVCITSLVFVVAFTFAVNFPSIVTGPVQLLSEAITQIQKKNYAHRIHLDTRDELGNLAKAFNQMAERLEYFESSNLNKILFEKKRAEAVINSLKEASIGIGNNEQILFANDQALQLLHLTSDSVVGKQTETIAAENDLFRFLINDHDTAPFKIVVEGQENYFIKETIAIHHPGTESRMIVIKNITSFKELDIAKNNFIAAVSHELKTPLAASDLSLRFLEDKRSGSLNHDQRELVANIRQDNQRMLKILSELLNMAQVETGQFKMKITPTAVQPMLNDALLAVAALAAGKNISILQMPLPIESFVKADAEKTVWVLTNLLNNAIRYSSKNGTVRLLLSDKGDHVLFSVENQGKTIPQEYLSRVFDRYFRIPGDSSAGTGIGLAVCKEFIEAQDGRIWAECTKSGTCVFSFTLSADKISEERFTNSVVIYKLS